MGRFSEKIFMCCWNQQENNAFIEKVSKNLDLFSKSGLNFRSIVNSDTYLEKWPQEQQEQQNTHFIGRDARVQKIFPDFMSFTLSTELLEQDDCLKKM